MRILETLLMAVAALACLAGCQAANNLAFVEAQLSGADPFSGSPAMMMAGPGAGMGGASAAQLQMMQQMQHSQQMFQMMSNMQQMNHETSMSIIRNMGGASAPMDHYENGVYKGTW